MNNASAVLAEINLKYAIVTEQFTVEIGSAREALSMIISGVTQLSPQGREMAVTRIIDLLVTVSSVLGHGSFLVSKAAVEKLAKEYLHFQVLSLTAYVRQHVPQALPRSVLQWMVVE